MELFHDTASAPALEKKRSSRLFALAFAASLGLHVAAGAAFLYRTPSSGTAAGSPEAISVSLVPSTVLNATEEEAAVQQEAAASAPVEGAETGKRQAQAETTEKAKEQERADTPPPDVEPAKRELDVSPVPPVLTARAESPDAVPQPARTQADVPRPEPRPRDPKPKDKPRHARKTPPSRRQAAASGRGAGAKSGRVSAGRGSLTDYITAIRARMARHSPEGLAAGTAKVAFAISASGRLIYARLARSSGSAALDAAAVRAVRAAAPFPPPPSGRTFSTVIPFESR